MKQQRQTVTANDIAKLVGVCRQAVSSTLTGRGNSKVSEEKRREILRLAEELGYRSNVSALQLAGHRTYTIGLIAGNHILTGALNMLISDKINARGYQLVQMMEDKERLQSTLNELIARGVEGVICSSIPNYDRTKLPVPILQISHTQSEIDLDYENTGYQVGRHLLRHGHRKLLMLDGVPDTINSIREYSGMQRAGGAQIEIRRIFLFRNPDGNRQILEAVKDGFTGIFCTYDNYAWRLLVFLRQHGYRVPEDLAVIGFGGHIYNEYLNPSLTSVIYPVHELAELAVEHLVTKINAGNLQRLDKELLIQPKLNIGRSCGCEERRLKNVYWEGNFVSIESAYRYIEQPPDSLLDQYQQITEE